MAEQHILYTQRDKYSISSSAHYDETTNTFSIVPQKEEEYSITPNQKQLVSPSSSSYKSKYITILNQEKTKYKITKPFASRNNQRDTAPKFHKDIRALSRSLKTNMTLVTYNLMFDLSQSSRPNDIYVYEQIKCQTNSNKNNINASVAATTAATMTFGEEERNREVKKEIKLSAYNDDDAADENLFSIDSSLDDVLDGLLRGYHNNNQEI